MQIQTSPDSHKQAEMLKLLQKGTVMLFVDSRHKDVLVPPHLKDDFQLRLNYDYAYQIHDFQVFADRVEASLSFNQRNSFCVVPFEAVYLMVSHATQQAVLFLHSAPVEMLDYFSKEAKKQEKGHEVRQRLASVKMVRGGDRGQGSGSSEEKKKIDKTKKVSKKKGHLRVVK